jgi:GDP-L-fucose synthase
VDKHARIFITGHTGLVGSAIYNKLQAEGYINLITVEHAIIDLTKETEVKWFMKDNLPEYVFNCAGLVGGIWANSTYPVDYLYHNMMIGMNMVKYSYEVGVKKLLVLGSSCIYPKDCKQPIDESYLLSSSLEQTNEGYALAKISTIKLAQAYNKQYATNFISVMPCSLFGDNDNFHPERSHLIPAIMRKMHEAKISTIKLAQAYNKQYATNFISVMPCSLFGDNDNFHPERSHLIPAIMRKMHEAKIKGDNKVEIWGSGTPLREFMHTNDLSDGLLFLMNNYDSSEVINLGTGEDYEIREIVLMIKDIVGYEGELNYNLDKPDGTMRKLLDSSKITELGWKPKIDIYDGLMLLYNWYVKELENE